jgi:hypothetical protein
MVLQLREKRLEQEKDLLVKQKDWFESQLKEKSEAYFTLKKELVSNPNHIVVNHIISQSHTNCTVIQLDHNHQP